MPSIQDISKLPTRSISSWVSASQPIARQLLIFEQNFTDGAKPKWTFQNPNWRQVTLPWIQALAINMNYSSSSQSAAVASKDEMLIGALITRDLSELTTALTAPQK